MSRKLIWIVLMLCASVILSACNTVQGIGKDVRKAGEVIEGAGKK